MGFQGDSLLAVPSESCERYSLRPAQIDFSKIVKKIDGMVELLKTEDKDDASKKGYCGKEFHEAELKTKSVASTITSLTATVEQSKGAIAQLATEIKGLQAQGHFQDMSKSILWELLSCLNVLTTHFLKPVPPWPPWWEIPAFGCCCEGGPGGVGQDRGGGRRESQGRARGLPGPAREESGDERVYTIFRAVDDAVRIIFLCLTIHPTI